MALYKEDILDIELNSGSIARSFLHHTIGSGDQKANRFGVRLFRKGEPVSAESATVTGLFMAPDGTRYVISETSYAGSTGKEGNKAYVQLPPVCYAVTGQFTLAIKLTSGGVEGTMRIIDGTVDETGEDGAVVPTSTIPTTAEIIEAYEEAVAVMGGSVRFDATQSLTSTEKAKARENIEAAADADVQQNKIALKRNVVGINVRIDVNTTTNTAEVTGGRIISNGHEYSIPSAITISNIPQDTTLRYLIATLDASTDNVTSIAIVDKPGGPWVDGYVYLGYVYQNQFATVPGIALFWDGLRRHFDAETWTEYHQFGVRCLGGPERMIIVNMETEKVTIPQDLIIISGNYSISTSAEQVIDFSQTSGNNLYLVYNHASNDFSVIASTFNRNNRMLIAVITRSMNYVFSLVPTLTVTNHTKYYDVMPEVAVYGDSVVAGAGGIGFENIIAAKAGIRMLNYGIGSTGYITRVTAGTTHLVGNGTPRQGTQQTVDYAENNVTDRIVADIADIPQNIIAIMAGTNDVATGKSVSAIIEAVETCVNTIINAGKIPVIISPIRRENVDIEPFRTALRAKCAEIGVRFIDVYDIGIMPSNSVNKAKYIPDGIHPSDAGYYLLAAAIANGMKNICMVDKYY